MIFLSDIIFTATRPQTPDENLVKFYVIDSYADSSMFDNLSESLLATLQPDDETLREISFEGVNYTDTESSDYYTTMVLMVRMAAGDGDAYISNEGGYLYTAVSGVYLPLDEYIANGWLAEYDMESVEYTDAETGESYIAALKFATPDSLKALRVTGDETYIGIAGNTTNLESTMRVIEEFLRVTMGQNS